MAWQEQQSCLLPVAGLHTLKCFKRSSAALCALISLFSCLCRTFARHRSNHPTFFLMVHLAATEILTAAPEASRHILNINVIFDIWRRFLSARRTSGSWTAPKTKKMPFLQQLWKRGKLFPAWQKHKNIDLRWNKQTNKKAKRSSRDALMSQRTVAADRYGRGVAFPRCRGPGLITWLVFIYRLRGISSTVQPRNTIQSRRGFLWSVSPACYY